MTNTDCQCIITNNTNFHCEIIYMYMWFVIIFFVSATEDIHSLYSIGAFHSSRFLISLLNMLTYEIEAVDLSMLNSEGLLGISQSIIKWVIVMVIIKANLMICTSSENGNWVLENNKYDKLI